MRPPHDQAAFVEWLATLVAAGPPRGRDARMLAAALDDALGHPHRVAPAVHIVGTAGKGSVGGLLTDRVVKGGWSVATHQSPHVHDVRERFLLDGSLPPWPLVLEAAAAVFVAVDVVQRAHGRPPSFFSVTTAMSWELGRRHAVDLFVTEAGIGGRHDATALLDRPDTLTVITAIGLDHIDILGSTVEEIAEEKAAVLAGRRLAVVGPQPHSSAASVVRRIALAHGVEVDEVDGSYVDWREEATAVVDAVAARLAAVLGAALPPVAPDERRFPPGRHEVIEVDGRRVVLDGAHNPLKLEALRRVLAIDGRAGCVIAAVARGKDLSGCAAALARLGAPVITIAFGADGSGRPSWPAEALAEAILAAGGDAAPAYSISDAVRQAHASTGQGETIVVTGSFLILAEVGAAVGR